MTAKPKYYKKPTAGYRGFFFGGTVKSPLYESFYLEYEDNILAPQWCRKIANNDGLSLCPSSPYWENHGRSPQKIPISALNYKIGKLEWGCMLNVIIFQFL